MFAYLKYFWTVAGNIKQYPIIEAIFEDLQNDLITQPFFLNQGDNTAAQNWSFMYRKPTLKTHFN